MLITGTQIGLHLLGDYVLQSDWMANNKTKRSWPCLIHVTLYTLPFLFLTRSFWALFAIWLTHFLIDRFGLARYVMWVKNHMAPFLSWNLDPKSPDYLALRLKRPFSPWKECQQTGYHDQTLDPRPIWIRVWLTIVADNTLHLFCNGVALYLAGS